MIYPLTTAFYAGVFGLVFAALSAWVVAGRARFSIHTAMAAMSG